MDLVTVVPRTCTVRQELEAWGRQQPALPLLVEKPGRTKDEAPRRWQGQRVFRQVAVEDSAGRGTQEALRLVVVHSRQLAQQHTHTYAIAQGKEAEAIAVHEQRVQARGFACRPDAETALAEYQGGGQGRRGRRPRPWRDHTGHSHIVSDTRHTRRARRGRPAQTDPPPTESGYRLVVEIAALANAEEDHGGTVLATTVSAEACADAHILHAYQEQNTTVEPGLRWIKNPAAISPVWLEKPERIAALAMRTVVGFLVDTVSQRQVRLSLRTQNQQVPGNKGETTIPTATVVLALLSSVTLVQVRLRGREVYRVYGVQPHHLLIGDALGLPHSSYEAPSAHKNGKRIHAP